jgi:hypothetical protein
MTGFTIYCLIAGLVFNIIGIELKFYPPKKFTWWSSGVRIPAALRSEESWHEANRFFALPSFIASSFFIVCAILPEIFPATAIFTETFATIIISLTVVFLMILTHVHLNKLFDGTGVRRS